MTMANPNNFGIKNWLRLIATMVWIVIFVFWPRIIFGVTFITIGSVAIAYNAMIFWNTVVCKDHALSVVPFIGGIFAALGIMFLPIAEGWKWTWIPLVIDWGGFPMFIAWCAGYKS